MNTENSDSYKVVYSVVSHGQLSLICSLLRDIRGIIQKNQCIVLVINIPEDEKCLYEFADLPIFIIRNTHKMGFGKNHNQAFSIFSSEYFIIVNPDIRLPELDLSILLEPFFDSSVGAVGPFVKSPQLDVEDSARYFPTFKRLFIRFFFGKRTSDYFVKNKIIEVDWCAGMFIAFRSSAYKKISGFDDSYFMYLEDADICKRLQFSNFKTVLQPNCFVIHDAQRSSKKNLRHFIWHVTSAIRFLVRY